jgi:hypothetical protein
LGGASCGSTSRSEGFLFLNRSNPEVPIPDFQIADQVTRQLHSSTAGSLHDGSVRAEVKGGTATLDGTVNSPEEKISVGDLVKAVAGVKNNEIVVVDPSERQQKPDLACATSSCRQIQGCQLFVHDEGRDLPLSCVVGVIVRRERRWTSAGATPARELVRSTR